MTVKPRVKLGESAVAIEAPARLVTARHHTLALATFGWSSKIPLDKLGLEVDLGELKGNTTFEQLTCVGLTPSMDQLSAVVRVNANAGYSGPLCGSGSTEHVRFYVSTDDGATWTDAGADSFPVHDTSGPRPIDFVVNVVTPLRHTLCWIENHPLVRAILSWNVAPTPADPDFTPAWGNVVDVRVRPRNRLFPSIHDLIDLGALRLSGLAQGLLDLSATIPVKPQPVTPLPVLAKAYAQAEVAPHRFAFPAYLAHVGQVGALSLTPLPVPGPAPDPAPFPQPPVPPLVPPLGGTFGEVLESLHIDLSDFLVPLFQTDGNTDYEELGCIGYDPVEDAVGGVFTVKRPYGYLGESCSAGSTEHVAFWVDWGSGWEHVGTTATTVHDEAIPDGGLRYSVYHPLGSYAHRRDCVDGPVQPRLRAILSWEQAPPPGDPNWVPTWGNREETTIELPAGAVSPLHPVLESITGQAVCQIDPSTGRTIVHQRPFGAGVGIAGFIPGAPDLGAPAMKYKLIARQIGAGGAVVSTEELRDTFSVWVTESLGGAAPTQYVVTQSADSNGWFTYLNDPNPSGAGWRQVVGNLLYPWSSEPRVGLWEIELRAKDSGGTEYAAQVITCPDSTIRQRARIYLDQARPTVDVEITQYRMPGAPWIPAGNCMKFPIGAILGGTFSATDEHFDHISLGVEGAPYPTTTPGGAARWVISGATAYPGAPTSGTNGTWEFDTAGMPACGYVLRGTAVDRTITTGGSWWDDDVSGFSLQ